MINRRTFLSRVSKASFAGASAPLWLNLLSSQAFAQAAGSYKAVVLVSLPGGNDGNNTLIPVDAAEYNEYMTIRGNTLAISQGTLLPLAGTSDGKSYAVHPSLKNVSSLYNQKRASFVANIGPMRTPATKAQILADSTLLPEALLSHPQQLAQWESATTSAAPVTGWGGRMADLLSTQSGSLPALLDAGPSSIFTVGRAVQGIAVQADGGDLVALPTGMDAAVLAIAQAESQSPNAIIAQAAQLRVLSAKQQVVLRQAQAAGSGLHTVFPTSGFGNVLKTIAQVMAGRSIVGAARQIFYCTQGGYDTHQNQWGAHAAQLADLDAGLGAFMAALDELGLTNQVLICTHSDFNRTMQANSTQGTDHAWGNHQILLGGGIHGGQVLGTMPVLELGGSSDLGTLGTWIPTTSVTQMTAGVGGWMGLNATQLASVFPDLANFPTGALAI